MTGPRCSICSAPIETPDGWDAGMCEEHLHGPTFLELLDRYAVPGLVGMLLGLFLSSALGTGRPAELAESRALISQMAATQAHQDAALQAGHRVIGQAVPLCGALADLQPPARRRGARP